MAGTSDCPDNRSGVDVAGKAVARGVDDIMDVEELRGGTSETVE
jgi:hypothetical protein